MPDFLPAPRLPEGLAETLIQQISRRGDILSQGIQNFGQGISSGIQRRSNMLTPEQISYVQTLLNNRRQTQPGQPPISQPLPPGAHLNQAGSELYTKLAGEEASTQKALTLAQVKDHTRATAELLKSYPSISKIGFQEGDLVPNRIIEEQTKPQQAAEEKKQKNLDERVTAMGKDLDPSAFRAGAFGVSKQVFDRSERLGSLMSAVDAFQGGNADSRQMEELAIGLNSMLSGANTGAQEQIKSLVPKTIWGDKQKLQEWLTGEPTGLDQQEFVKRLKGTVEREANTAQLQIKRTRFQRLSKWDDVRKKDPERWETTARSFEVDPSEYDAWKKGGFKTLSAVQSPKTQADISKMSNDELLGELNK